MKSLILNSNCIPQSLIMFPKYIQSTDANSHHSFLSNASPSFPDATSDNVNYEIHKKKDLQYKSLSLAFESSYGEAFPVPC